MPILVRAHGGPLTGGYAYVNLGFSGALQVPEQRSAQYRIAFHDGAARAQIQTMDGVESIATTEVEALVIGPFEFRTLQAHVTLGGNPDQVLIGSEVWSRFKILVIDYGRRRLLVESGPDFGEPIGTGSNGLSLIAKGEALDRFIVDVQAESSAERAGLRTGDALESVEGVPMSELRFDRAWHLIRSRGRAGESLRLTILRGEERVEMVIPPEDHRKEGLVQPGR